MTHISESRRLIVDVNRRLIDRIVRLLNKTQLPISSVWWIALLASRDLHQRPRATPACEARFEKEVTMSALLFKLLADDQGQDIAEYAVMLAVILVLVVGTVRLLGSNRFQRQQRVLSGSERDPIMAVYPASLDSWRSQGITLICGKPLAGCS
jgi:Flp pilus assembly pilin Flp